LFEVLPTLPEEAHNLHKLFSQESVPTSLKVGVLLRLKNIYE